MDWNLIKFPEPRSTRVQITGLPPFFYWLLFASAKLQRKSMSEVAKTALILYLKKRWRADSPDQRDHEIMLTTEANGLGISPEELFNRLVNDAASFTASRSIPTDIEEDSQL